MALKTVRDAFPYIFLFLFLLFDTRNRTDGQNIIVRPVTHFQKPRVLSIIVIELCRIIAGTNEIVEKNFRSLKIRY